MCRRTQIHRGQSMVHSRVLQLTLSRVRALAVLDSFSTIIYPVAKSFVFVFISRSIISINFSTTSSTGAKSCTVATQLDREGPFRTKSSVHGVRVWETRCIGFCVLLQLLAVARVTWISVVCFGKKTRRNGIPSTDITKALYGTIRYLG